MVFDCQVRERNPHSKSGNPDDSKFLAIILTLMLNRDAGPLVNFTRTRELSLENSSGVRAADPNSAALELHCRSVSDHKRRSQRWIVMNPYFFESACRGHALSDSMNSKKRQENQGFPH
jgi:hypothetical protein